MRKCLRSVTRSGQEQWKPAVRLASTAAVVYSSCFPNVRFHVEQGIVVASGLPASAYPRGGLCVGLVFLTGKQPTAAVLRHEAVHAKQWQQWGWRFPFLYWAAGRDPLTNRFEVDAGLAEGGYLPVASPAVRALSHRTPVR